MSTNTQASQKRHSESTKGDADEFHILPIDQNKEHPHPSQGRSSESSGGHTGPRSEFYVGPPIAPLMPGPFISSMGAGTTASEREQASKAEKD